MAVSAALSAAALLLAGCGSSTETADTATQSGASTVNPSEMTDAQNPPERLVIDVTIKGGEVTPTNEQLQAGLNEQIVIRVDSDAVDELHVHSSPDHTFPVAIGPAQSFQFSVGVPGRVDVELHDLGTTIATIQVQ
ncbi:hypothetical protein [Mycolicibacterium iranicum]|uniref:EfeO-type cupredoxin-like domain-containing protein n=1 Tax=Mycolicibacterium iranicum TaxID=912594 RepID=A0A178LUC5_MYCIR|nr:hypothetical protein [Mycolicibacterium iranicum]OAN37035.1 hypothetical protein A4X20_24020 [Mycolicibacterium iranicum]